MFLLGCSRRRRFRFLWHKRKTAIITILITPKPRPITTYSFISDSLTPVDNRKNDSKQKSYFFTCNNLVVGNRLWRFNLQDCSSDWSRFPCSSRPQLCIPLHCNCLEIQNSEYLHLNVSAGHCWPFPSLTSVQVALNPFAPTDLFAI